MPIPDIDPTMFYYPTTDKMYDYDKLPSTFYAHGKLATYSVGSNLKGEILDSNSGNLLYYTGLEPAGSDWNILFSLPPSLFSSGPQQFTLRVKYLSDNETTFASVSPITVHL
jgi:hypothetical protein